MFIFFLLLVILQHAFISKYITNKGKTMVDLMIAVIVIRPPLQKRADHQEKIARYEKRSYNMTIQMSSYLGWTN